MSNSFSCSLFLLVVVLLLLVAYSDSHQLAQHSIFFIVITDKGSKVTSPQRRPCRIPVRLSESGGVWAARVDRLVNMLEVSFSGWDDIFVTTELSLEREFFV